VVAQADAFRMEQVFINLLTNAMKYGAGKPIRVEITRAGNGARIAVRDEGMGIPEEKQALIFDRFERAVNSQNITGLGLGLYIARQIVLAHKGEISVESTPGAGSRFTVVVPFEQKAAGDAKNSGAQANAR
jgi:signal transduction histidine kinase